MAAASEVTLWGLLGSTQVAAGWLLKLPAELEGCVSTEHGCIRMGKSAHGQDSLQPVLISKFTQNIQTQEPGGEEESHELLLGVV